MNLRQNTIISALSRFSIISFVLMSIAFAAETTDAGTKISGLVTTIYCLLTGIVPIIAFTLFVLAAVAYGVGQFFGADTRAKAATWGMAALTGAIVMLVIYLIGPMIVKGLYSASVTEITCVP